MSETRLEFRPNPKDVPEIMRRSGLILGQPFIQIPMETRPDEFKVLALIDGVKVRREHVEMVFNNTVLMDFTYALAGHRSEDNDPPGSLMAQVRALGRELYGSYGKWVELNYGVICLECNLALPSHTENCSAGIKNKAAAQKWNKPPEIAE